MSDQVDSRLRKCQAFCLGLLMFPKSALLVSNSPSLESMINPLIMLFLLMMTMFLAERKTTPYKKIPQYADTSDLVDSKNGTEAA